MGKSVSQLVDGWVLVEPLARRAPFPGRTQTGTDRKLWVISVKNSLEFQDVGVGGAGMEGGEAVSMSLETPKPGTKRIKHAEPFDEMVTISLFMKTMYQEQVYLPICFVESAMG